MTPNEPCKCPVAVWLTIRTSRRYAVLFGYAHQTGRVDAPANKLPPPVRKFIDAFDAGEYPDLCEAFPQ